MRRRTVLGGALILAILAGGAGHLAGRMHGGLPFCEGMWRQDLQLQRATAGLIGLVVFGLAMLLAVIAAFLDP
ncbi:hypothetical protein BKE38_23805 [Pseudoroseomonas deserti]|uniref:Uncharacterized protein n=1 Tax=Teichococcus deserti TaxID=1817963 RepID=A0A1V2GVY7_9PROT|nr:hypothetical protein [Pseudoroseomonas deserti]ONG47353.1 hypothetical protein BKE38_23805 [Pseudoroseomonas deserti]